MNDPVVKIRKALHGMLNIEAHAMGKFPKEDPFGHGKQVGRYEMLDGLIDQLNDIIGTDDENT